MRAYRHHSGVEEEVVIFEPHSITNKIMKNVRLDNVSHVLESILGSEENDNLQSLLTVWAVTNENKDLFADRSEFDADVASLLERSPDLGLEPIDGIEREVRSPPYFVIQSPRFRDKHKGQVRVSTGEDSEVRCTLHKLCESCQRLFGASRLIHGSYSLFVRCRETAVLHPSIQNLEEAVKLGCHFCTLVWQVIEHDNGGTLGPD